MAWVCDVKGSRTVSMFEYESNRWKKAWTYSENECPLLMVELSQDEAYIIGTFMTGFHLWQTEKKKDEPCTTLKLPSGIRWGAVIATWQYINA